MRGKGKLQLITRGDDLGSFRSANLAIVDAFKHGMLRNSSIMVPAPYFEDAVALVKDEKGLCLGLHVTLNCEWDVPRWGPVLSSEKVPSLVDRDGYLFRHPKQLFENGVRLDELVSEVQAQLDRAREKGLDIRYLDEHMGVGWIFNEADGIRLSERLRRMAEREGLIWHQDKQSLLPECEVEGLSLLEQLKRQLMGINEGAYVLIAHPAYAGKDMQAIAFSGYARGHIARERGADHRFLCSAELAQYVSERGIEVVRYDEVKEGCVVC